VTSVSIVTISFNQIEFLQRTIDSVLNQDYKDIEYIIVDPGSTDGSRDLIKQYDSRIACAIFEPDQGPADGLNKGFERSTGSVLGFLNSDDVLLPGAVSAAVRYLADHPSVDVVSGHAKVIGPDDRVLRRTYSDRMSLTRYIYGGIALIQPSTFFRRTAFERTNGFNIANRAVWDGELFFDMAKAGCRFDLSDEIWSGYRLHAESITASKRLEEERREIRGKQFLRVKGRSPNRWDTSLQVFCRLWRHLLNPRDTMERILRGPVFGRPLN
jgi:glycosyltransferase involved in cell wall biosynthesis